MAVITVLGAGMMGSAVCVPLVDRGHEVRLVGTHLDAAIVESLRAKRFHPTLRCELPAAIRPCFVDDLGAAMEGAEIVVLGVSSAGVRWATEKLAPFARPGLPLLMITKGLEFDGERLAVLPDVVQRGLPETVRAAVAPAAVAGPCIAGELARRVETCVVFTGRDGATLDRLAGAARGAFYHVVTSTDVVGAEVCAALKNAYAMGVAFGAGLHERRGGAPGSVAMHNWESAVFAQAIREMMRVVQMLGGDPMTATGLPGVGDLDVTMNGGRTGRFGRLLGLGLGVKEAVARMEGATLECLEILDVMRRALPVYEARGELGEGELPLLRHMAAVALDDAPVDAPLGRFFQS
jgi:glycerol-3-phosphate dehydrogenase (NAD(P)+)